jgi:hypothetical protein
MKDRTGEEIPTEPPDHICNDGWVGDPNADEPRACLDCKPWLDPEKRRRRVHGYDPGGPA